MRTWFMWWTHNSSKQASILQLDRAVVWHHLLERPLVVLQVFDVLVWLNFTVSSGLTVNDILSLDSLFAQGLEFIGIYYCTPWQRLQVLSNGLQVNSQECIMGIWMTKQEWDKSETRCSVVRFKCLVKDVLGHTTFWKCRTLQAHIDFFWCNGILYRSTATTIDRRRENLFKNDFGIKT